MNKKLTVEIAEGLGNQIFMYAFAYSISKKFNYDLFIDDKSGFSKKKNLLRSHQKYMLNNFNIEGSIANENMIFDTNFKRIKKKIIIFLDYFSIKKKFLIEKRKKINGVKYPLNLNIEKNKISNNLYIQGNFENYKYFNEYKSDLNKIFIPKTDVVQMTSPLISKMKNTNSISLHIRRNRFSDQLNLRTVENIRKSEIFSKNIIEYINKSVHLINSKVSNPEYFIWTNDHNNIENLINKIDIKNYSLVKNDTINDFNLFRYCKHFIVGPSSFHWWGAWLNNNPNKICIRPSNINPSNNENFWPNDWLSI